jgi:hypothetical protein
MVRKEEQGLEKQFKGSELSDDPELDGMYLEQSKGKSIPLARRKIPGTYFCQRLCRPQDYTAAGRYSSIKKSNDLIGNRTRDLLACSIVLQLRYRVPP